jgi:hypothetical protein
VWGGRPRPPPLILILILMLVFALDLDFDPNVVFGLDFWESFCRKFQIQHQHQKRTDSLP